MDDDGPSKRGADNAAMAAVLREAIEGRGWSARTVESKAATLKWRTIYRIMNNEKDIVIGEVIELAGILEIAPDELMRRATARKERDQVIGSGVPDPAAAARYLLDHPDEDAWLVGHLSDLTTQSGISRSDRKRLVEEARYQRRQHLLRVLEATPAVQKSSGPNPGEA